MEFEKSDGTDCGRCKIVQMYSELLIFSSWLTWLREKNVVVDEFYSLKMAQFYVFLRQKGLHFT